MNDIPTNPREAKAWALSLSDEDRGILMACIGIPTFLFGWLGISLSVWEHDGTLVGFLVTIFGALVGVIVGACLYVNINRIRRARSLRDLER